MRKNFLTIGAVIALAWVSLAPLSLLFIATIVSSHQPVLVKGGVLLLILFSWIFLSMGVGVFWRKESGQPMTPFPAPVQKKDEAHSISKKREVTKPVTPETLRALQEADFSALCLRIFERMWPTVTFEKCSGESVTDQNWIFHLHQKVYLVHCESHRTFFDSREVQNFGEELKKRGANGGYFFAGGVFSKSAETVAADAKIELIDGRKASELIESFLNERDLPERAVSSPEKRHYPRFVCEAFPFEDRPSLELGSVYRRALKAKLPIMNLSTGGICIELPPSEELPTFFQLSLRLSSHPEPLHILGEVVWNRAQPGSQMKRYGISFVSLSEENREKLNLFLEKEVLAQTHEKKQRRIV